MACKREVAKKCRVAGGQPTWNETKGICECMAIKTDAKGNKIQRMKKGKKAFDMFGNPAYETESYTLARQRRGN